MGSQFKMGQKVKVTSGEFAGCIGEIHKVEFCFGYLYQVLIRESDNREWRSQPVGKRGERLPVGNDRIRQVNSICLEAING